MALPESGSHTRRQSNDEALGNAPKALDVAVDVVLAYKSKAKAMPTRKKAATKFSGSGNRLLRHPN
jgi:hypothetical protein